MNLKKNKEKEDNKLHIKNNFITFAPKLRKYREHTIDDAFYKERNDIYARALFLK